MRINKNYFIFTLLALTLSACEGYNNAKPRNHAAQTADPSGTINNQTNDITRNVGNRTAVVNESGHKLP